MTRPRTVHTGGVWLHVFDNTAHVAVSVNGQWKLVMVENLTPGMVSRIALPADIADAPTIASPAP
ncbi:hypothetical protein ACQEVF_58630 [Nonomuraea polychroma]|uniref:hypothetical protein n=1 Tax=Nonomuraea polychroma TaxID=46176 RepID=UPI003D8CBFC3